MPLTLLRDRIRSLFGRRVTYSRAETPEEINQRLDEQTADAYTLAAWNKEQVADSPEPLDVQPGLLHTRIELLDHVLWLEWALAEARTRGLSPDLTDRLEDTVDHGHELVVLLADAARATTDTPTVTADHTPAA